MTINISQRGYLILLITYEPNLTEIIQTKAVRKFIGLRKNMTPPPPPKIWYLKVLPLNTIWITFESEHSSNWPAISWILQIIFYLIPNPFKHPMHPLLTEIVKCSSLPQLCNNNPQYFICHTVLRFPDSLQHGQNSHMGGEFQWKWVYCLFYSKGVFLLKALSKKEKGEKYHEENNYCKYNLGEVGFICFRSPMNFLTAFVWSITFKFG